jgi:hypothetical protein
VPPDCQTGTFRPVTRIRRLLRLPPRGRSGPWILALAIGLLLAIQPIWPDNYGIGVSLTLGVGLIAAARWKLTWAPVFIVLICGVGLRWATANLASSDVADVTTAAIRTMLRGWDPYGIGYVVSRPAGASFPYGPVALLWYLPMFRDPTQIEVFSSLALMGFFGIRAAMGRPLGLVLFALAPPLVLATVDGSNDTSAGLLILIALGLAAKRPVIGAAALAVAVAFKPYALAWLPPLALWAGVPAVLGFAAASVVAWSPVLFIWGVGSYLKSLSIAQQTHMREAYWSVASIWDGLLPGAAPRALETIRYFLSAAVAVVGGLRVKTIDGVIVVGTLAFVIAQFGGYFGSYVYVAAVAPILCYRVDDWLRTMLPELARAYDETAVAERRLPRAAAPTAPAPLPAPLQPAPSPAPVGMASAIHAVPRSRGPRSRDLTG